MSDALERMFTQHCESNEKEFDKLNSSIDLIKDNHLAHLDAKVDSLDRKVSVVGNDVGWLKKNQWFFLTTSVITILSIIGSVITYVITK